MCMSVVLPALSSPWRAEVGQQAGQALRLPASEGLRGSASATEATLEAGLPPSTQTNRPVCSRRRTSSSPRSLQRSANCCESRRRTRKRILALLERRSEQRVSSSSGGQPTRCRVTFAHFFCHRPREASTSYTLVVVGSRSALAESVCRVRWRASSAGKTFGSRRGSAEAQRGGGRRA